ncbi:hypothetical protein SCHPADRAFT_995223 [Schizopora paradoxa]|uniref:Uncharacterized protein n=1 Tax=Schizopora paradoxa TaxID=27342 RepID=A0A0H2RWM3_9AGAM|nr:hypothetical protein SCHPADRAFT_995223 [Schizopora paradoxa]
MSAAEENALAKEESAWDGQTCSRDSTAASNASKELLVSLISELEISYDAVERLLSAIKEETFLPEDVRFRVEDINSYAESRVPEGTKTKYHDSLEGLVLFENQGTPLQSSLTPEGHIDPGAFLRSSSNNCSEKLLASLVEDGSLSIKGMRRIVVAIGNDTFKSRNLLLESLESLIFYPLHARQKEIFQNNCVLQVLGSAPTTPNVVVQRVIDLLKDIAIPSLATFMNGIAWMPGYVPGPSRAPSVEAQRTLKCLSLVHPSWTSMVYRALGKSFRVPDMPIIEHTSPWTTSIQNPIYGTWTQELDFVITTNRRESEDARRSFFVANICRRFPALKTIRVYFRRLEDAISSLKMLMSLDDLATLTIELEEDAFRVPDLGVMDPLNSLFETLAHLRQLRTLEIPLPRTQLQGLKIPPQIIPLTMNPNFQELRIFVKDLEASGRDWDPQVHYPTILVWTKQDDATEDAFGFKYLQLCQLPDSFRPFSDRDKNSLTFLHVVCTENVPWNPVEHDLKSFICLQKVEVISEMPFIEVILESMPRFLESLLILFPRTMEYSEVDKMLERYITSHRCPSLKQLRVARSYFKDKPYSFRKMKISSSIPLTAEACQERNIEYGAWF